MFSRKNFTKILQEYDDPTDIFIWGIREWSEPSETFYIRLDYKTPDIDWFRTHVFHYPIEFIETTKYTLGTEHLSDDLKYELYFKSNKDLKKFLNEYNLFL